MQMCRRGNILGGSHTVLLLPCALHFTSLQAMQTKSCLGGASMSEVVVMMQCMLHAACESMMPLREERMPIK